MFKPEIDKTASLVVDAERAEELRQLSLNMTSLTLNRRQMLDLEMLLAGGFSPLSGFLGAADYQSVVNTMRLQNGRLWPIPVVMDVAKDFADKLQTGDQIALRDEEGWMVAVLTLEEIWERDKAEEAKQVFGSQDESHPGVANLLQTGNEICLSGRLEGIQLPTHYEFEQLWKTPQELRDNFRKLDWRRVIAFQTSRPMHRLHRDLLLEAADEHNAFLLIHPVAGITRPRDLQYYSRVHCYQAMMSHLPSGLAQLSLLPLAMRMAGPREALWHGLLHRNYGCSHYLVGPDDSSPRDDTGGGLFYEKYAAAELVQEYKEELGIEPICVEERRYNPRRRRFFPVSQIVKENNGNGEGEMFAEEELRRRMLRQEEIPEWWSFPEILAKLEKAYPPRSRQGFTLFFTGLSGSGKSTLAKVLYAKLIEEGSRPVTLLDGDIVRNSLSSELTFSKAHRDINIRRIGFVANEITKNGGVAICAPIAPYQGTRRAVRALIEEHGSFIEIHVSTPLEACEARDRKGLYAKARKGLIPEFTGISDPYEEPENAELVVDTTELSPLAAAREIILYLVREGYVHS
ncbi:MAG: bifunctional sulfate adenylyltransferase/adenylylsulfate kinase [Pseudomonadota bacterium]|nr:bifunctional sulfate adenylyltransferase/adenylylsulfate kinase [Pseudomonadota bacterium]